MLTKAWRRDAMEYDSEGSASNACVINRAVEVAIHCSYKFQFDWLKLASNKGNSKRKTHASRACCAPVITNPAFFRNEVTVLFAVISSANISLCWEEWPMGTRRVWSG